MYQNVRTFVGHLVLTDVVGAIRLRDAIEAIRALAAKLIVVL